MATQSSKKPRKNAARRPPAPAHRKRYDVNHQQGDDGEELVKSRLPTYWIKRKLAPDYGLDWHIEVFDRVPDAPEHAETRGEHFYIQVKSQESTSVKQRTVRSRGNVAKYRPDPKSGDQYVIPVVECELEVGELMTVEAMGNAVPVLLCVADMADKTVYYVCLNDYISKVLLPNKPNYTSQHHVTIHIPAWNVLDCNDVAFTYIQQLARRAKLYSAFNAFVYQRIELSREVEATPVFVDEDRQLAHLGEELVAMLDVFLSETTRLDIWESAGAGFWAPLKELGTLYASLSQRLHVMADWQPLEDVDAFIHDLEITTNKAVNIGRMYEELVREWRLPTILAAIANDISDSAYKANAIPTVKPAKKKVSREKSPTAEKSV